MAAKARRGKRANGEGSIFQRRDTGKWIVQVPDGYGVSKATGKTYRKYKTFAFDKQADAKKKLRDALNQLDRTGAIDTSKQTVAAFLANWLETVVKPPYKSHATYANYERHVRLHLIPAIGHLPLQRLQPADVQDMLNTQLRTKGATVERVAYTRTVLGIALAHAFRMGKVTQNVAKMTVLPRRRGKKEMRYFTPDEARRFLDAARGNRYEALFSVALNTGLRQGEILGLAWSDVDLDGQSVRVRRQLIPVDGRLALTDLKTEGSDRVVPLSRAVVDALRRHKARQNEERLRVGDRWRDHGLVFCNRRGGYLHRETVRDNYREVLGAANLPRLRFHDQRHSFATLALATGVDPLNVKQALGHTKLATTMDRYAHVLPEAMRQVSDAMDRLFGTVEATGD
jgi:integrase